MQVKSIPECSKGSIMQYFHARIQEFSSGGSRSVWQKTALTTLFFGPQLVLEKSKGQYLRNLSFSRFQRGSNIFQGGGGVQLFQRGSNCPPIETHITCDSPPPLWIRTWLSTFMLPFVMGVFIVSVLHMFYCTRKRITELLHNWLIITIKIWQISSRSTCLTSDSSPVPVFEEGIIFRRFFLWASGNGSDSCFCFLFLKIL